MDDKRLTDDDIRTEAEIAPEGLRQKSQPKSKTSVRTKKFDDSELALKRIEAGFSLARIVIFGMLGAYFIGSVGLLITGEASNAVELTLEVIRLLVPPLTFILGFLFGTKQQS